MTHVVSWCGFFGAWLLVAGPIAQSALELNEQEIERDRIAEVAGGVTPPPSVSGWWWLVPPVRWLLQWRRGSQLRESVMGELSREDIDALLTYVNKATGWLFVGLGGLLIAVKETWELREHYEWPLIVFWVLIVGMFLLSVGITAERSNRTRDILQRKEQAEAAERLRGLPLEEA